jgi:nucleoside-diphosphate-sugar epimerase
LQVVGTTKGSPTRAALDFLDEYEALVKWISVDVREKRQVEEAVGETGVDTLIHCAAITSISANASVSDMLSVNLVGTRNVLEAARVGGQVRVVFVSSGAVYGDRDSPVVREDHPLGGESPYAVSKIAAEQLCRSYAEEHQLSVAICRLGTLYGPMEIANPHRPRVSIPCRLVNLALSKNTISVFGLSRKRPFCHVGDAARAVIDLALLSDLPSDTLNTGSPKRVALSDLLDVISRLRPDFSYEDAESHHGADLVMTRDDERPVLDTTRLESYLGTRQWLEMEEGIESYMNWLRESST